MATLRQIQAAAENARRNTGPRASGGAGNARTHGLTASKVISDQEKEMIAARLADLERELFPEGALQKDEVLAMASASVRLERCQLEEEDWRLYRAERAEFYWDADRWVETMKLVQGLPKKPHVILPKLRQSLRGCLWILGELRDLAGRVRGTAAGGSPQPLDEKGRQRAFDLLGLSEDRRLGSTPLDLPGGAGSDAAVAAHQDAVLSEQIAELETMVGDDQVALDESIRIATVNGAAPGIDNETRLIRRYETEARRVKEKAYTNFQRLKEEARVQKKETEERARQDWMDTNLVCQPFVRAPVDTASTQEAAEPEAPAAAVEQVEATEATPTMVAAKGMSVVEEVLAEIAGMADPSTVPISTSQTLSRRAQKAMARAAHRTLS